MLEVGAGEESERQVERDDVRAAGEGRGLHVRQSGCNNRQHTRLDASERIAPDGGQVLRDVDLHGDETSLHALQHIAGQHVLGSIRLHQVQDVAIELNVSASCKAYVDEIALRLLLHIGVVRLHDARQHQVHRVIHVHVLVQQGAQLAQAAWNVDHVRNLPLRLLHGLLPRLLLLLHHLLRITHSPHTHRRRQRLRLLRLLRRLFH